MFGWRKKKNDDFEWHKYVRTTILARREHRRERLDHAKEQAADGIKFGIRQSASWGQSGANRAWTGIKHAVATTHQLAVKFSQKIAARVRPAARKIGSGLASAFSAIWDTIKNTGRQAAALLIRGLRPVGDLLRSPSVRAPLGLIGVLAGLAGLWQWYGHGLDPQAKIALAISITALLLVYGPIFFQRYQITTPIWILWIGRSLLNLPRNIISLVTSSRSQKPGNQIGAATNAGSFKGLTTGLARLAIVGALTALGWFGYKSLPAASNLFAGLSWDAAFSGKADPITGRANALTGDLLQIDDQTIALAGIDAPEILQRCKRGRRKWRCGATARWALAKMIRRKELHCEPTGTDNSGAILATCRIGETDVAAELVRKGYVFATTGFLATYAALETEARTSRLRIWKGSNLRPEAYRAKTWEAAKRRAPDGCPIKGNVTRAGKVYVLPWAVNYKKVKIKTSKGERWFCSEQSARDAGWRAHT